MIATTWTFALLLLEAPAAAEECALTDNRCRAGMYERRAAKAPSAGKRALFLYTAYRSYFFLFEKTGDARDLCAARRALDSSLAVADQPQAQREKSEHMRDALADRERAEGARCKGVAGRRIKKADAPLLVARHAAPVEPPPGPAAPPDSPTNPAAADSPATTATTPVAHPRPNTIAPARGRGTTPTGRRGPDARAPGARARAVNPATTPRPGRGLVIAGGVTLGVGVALTAAAASMGRRMLDTRQKVFALDNMIDDYATTDQATTGNALLREYDAMNRQTLALALASGATVIVAALLVGVGGRRMARAASRTALIPAPGGLVFHARF
jgi:hypothetical protein